LCRADFNTLQRRRSFRWDASVSARWGKGGTGMLNKRCRPSCKTCNTCNMQLATAAQQCRHMGDPGGVRGSQPGERWNGVSFHTEARTNFRGHNFN